MAEKELRALGDRVIIKFQEVKKKKRVTPGGIELIGASGASEEKVFEAIVDTIGNKIDLESCGFKVGDSIIFNDYNIKQFDVPNLADPINPIRKGIIGESDVWGVYE